MVDPNGRNHDGFEYKIAEAAAEAMGLNMQVKRPADGQMWGGAQPRGSGQNYSGTKLILIHMVYSTVSVTVGSDHNILKCPSVLPAFKNSIGYHVYYWLVCEVSRMDHVLSLLLIPCFFRSPRRFGV